MEDRGFLEAVKKMEADLDFMRGQFLMGFYYSFIGKRPVVTVLFNPGHQNPKLENFAELQVLGKNIGPVI
jgi:hypothetical protein